MASIVELGNGKYRAHFCVDRIRKSRVIHAKNLKDAEKQAIILEEKIRETGSMDKELTKELKRLTFIELGERYIKWRTKEKTKKIADKTHQKYTDILEYHLTPYFMDTRVVHIREYDVEKLLAYMKTPDARFNKSKFRKGYSDTTVKDCYNLLNQMLSYARDKLKIITYNPCDGVDTPTIEDRDEMPYYDNEQLVELLRNADTDAEKKLAAIEAKRDTGRYQPLTLQKEKVQVLFNRAALYISVYTATRRGEVLGIKREDIDFEKKTIHFCRQVLYTKMKGIYLKDGLKTLKENTIGINDDLIEIIKELITEEDVLFELAGDKIPKTDMLFFALNNTKRHDVGGLPNPDHMSEWFKALVEQYNMPYMTFHKLRHSSISYMLWRGVDPMTVRKIAGHATMEQIEKTYGHVYLTRIVSAAEVFDELGNKEKSEDEQED